MPRHLFALAIAVAAVACSNAPRASVPTPTAATTPTTATSSPTPTVVPSPSLAPTAVPVVRYVAIGASDTVGVGAADPTTGSWPARLAAKLPAGATYLNLGVSGSLASGAREQQLPKALEARPTHATVWLAVNGLNAGLGPGDYGMAPRSV